MKSKFNQDKCCQYKSNHVYKFVTIHALCKCSPMCYYHMLVSFNLDDVFAQDNYKEDVGFAL